MGSILLHDGVVAYEDWSPLSTQEDLFRPYVIPWDFLHNLGSPVPLTTLGNLIYNLPLIALAVVLGSAVMAVKAQLLLMLWLSGISWALFFRRLTLSNLGAFLGGLWMMFNPFINSRFELAHGTIILAYILSPFLLLSFHDLIFQGTTGRGIQALLLSVIISLLSPAIFFMNLIFIILLSLTLFLYIRKPLTYKLTYLSRLFLLLSIALLAMISIVLVTGAGAPSINAIRAEEAGIPGDIVLALQRYPYFISALLFSIIIGLYAYRYRRKPASEVTKAYISAILISSTFTAMLILLALQPRSQVFRILFYNVPGLQLFREVNKLLLFPVIGVGLLFAKIGQHINWELRGVRLPVLVVSLTILTISSVWPSSTVKMVELPKGYQELRGFLEAQRGEFRIAYLPPASWATRFSWADHYFLDPAVVFMPKPTVYMTSEQEQTPGSSFVRWVYSSFYQGRTSRLGSLMGLLGVKYIIFRPDADTPKHHDGLRWMGITETQNLLKYQRDLREVSRFGDYVLYETPYHYSILYSPSQIITTAGDRNLLHDLLEIDFPLWNSAIVPIETVNSREEFIKRCGVIVIQGGDPSPLLAALGGRSIRPWEELEFSSDPSDAWYAGGAAWWYGGGRVNSAPAGFAITTGENAISKRIIVPRRGDYLLFISVFSSSSDSRGLEVSLGGLKKTIRPTSRISTDYTWEVLGPVELEGEASMELRGLGGLNAVSTIYLASLEELEDAERMLADRAHKDPLEMIFLLDEDSWISEKNLTLISSPQFIGGSAIRFSGSLRSNFTTIWEDDYFILAKVGERDLNVSVSVDGISLRELEYPAEEPKYRVYGPIKLRGGKHSIEFYSRGEALLDLVAISTSDPSSWRRTGPNRMIYSGNPASEYRFFCTEGMLVAYNMDHLNLWLPRGCRKIGGLLEYGALYLAENEGECALNYIPFTVLLPHFTLHIAFSSTMLLIGLLTILRKRR